MNYLVIGGVSFDTILTVDSMPKLTGDNSVFINKRHKTVGGTGAGKALCLDVLSENTTLITAIGDDQEGGNVKNYFSDKNINLKIIKSDVTTTHTNIMYDRGNRISLFTSLANVFPSFDVNNYLNLIEEADYVFLNINGFCREFIPILKSMKKKIIVDIHDYDEVNEYHQEFIDAATIVFASGVNLKDTKYFMRSQITSGKELVVVTKGPKGYEALDEYGVFYKEPAFEGLAFVDSNGAGDSFCAGFIVEFSKTGDLVEALQFANKCGAVSCSSTELFHPEYTYEKIKTLKKGLKI